MPTVTGRTAFGIAMPLLAMMAPVAVSAQDLPPVTYPPLPAEAATAEAFVPKGWEIETRAEGDLDGDSKADHVLILRNQDRANIIPAEMCGDELDTNPSMLAVLLSRPGGGYRLAVENHALIPRRANSCQLDGLTAISIERGILGMDFERMMSAGGWDMGSAAFKWRWRDGALKLVGFDYSNIKRNTGAIGRLSVNYLTGRAKISTGNIGSDRETVRWKALRSRRAPTISEVGDGLMFDPEKLVSNLP
ncbi:MAG TPA: hypothetical protein VF688_10855 [Allosphingosinicella sp.]|jgi:hypothetical protein